MENKINELIEIELKQADEKFSDFHSTHEGWAVLLEEFEEASEEIHSIKIRIDRMWSDIRYNDNSRLFAKIDSIKDYTIKAIEELIQVAAMCDKFNRLKVKEC